MEEKKIMEFEKSSLFAIIANTYATIPVVSIILSLLSLLLSPGLVGQLDVLNIVISIILIVLPLVFGLIGLLTFAKTNKVYALAFYLIAGIISIIFLYTQILPIITGVLFIIAAILAYVESQTA